MKKLFRANILIVAGLLVIACGSPSQQATPIRPTSTPILIATSTIEFTPTQITDLLALPTLSFPDGTNIPFPTPNPKVPTLVPTIDPKLVSDLLRKAISIQTLKGTNGHALQRITGWDYGFRQKPCYPYQWLDSNYLLLYPRTGEQTNIYHDGGGREDLGSEPIVVNLTSGDLWLRPPSSVPISSTDKPEQDCNSVYRSQELGLIINQQSYASTFGPVKDAVFTYTFDGQLVAEYWGKILGVSPRGEKILVDEDTIIDLSQNKIIDLAWHMNYGVGDSPTLYWSSDETRLYRCCFYYADLKTGESYDFKWSDLRGADGTSLTFPMHPHKYGQWVRNDGYFLIEWDYWTIMYGDPIPMFSPAEKKYYDLAEIAGIPPPVVATSISMVSPDGLYLWLKGYGDDGQYHGFLVNLVDFKTVPHDKSINDFEWSPDSKYAWVSIYDTSDRYVLSTTSKESTPFPVQPINVPSWRPADHMLAFFTEQNQTLAILDAKDTSVKEWKLPSSFHSLIWSPDGNHIALITTDGSLWQVDYPKMEKIEQLTEPMPAGDVQWSPDGNSIAFISGSDIYVVDTTK
jgi:hypothetical protein